METSTFTSSLDQRLEDPGDHLVKTPIIVVITRFGLRSFRYLLPTYLDYRRVVTEAVRTRTPGLLRSVFLIENPTTCYSLSIWTGREAIALFGTHVPYHVRAGNRVFGRLSLTKNRGPEIWSAKLRLDSVSNNLNWQDFNLLQLILKTSR